MATREEIVATLADLKLARHSGLKVIKRGDRELTYRSDSELLAAIRDLEGELAALDGAKRRRRVFTTSTSKGY